MGSRILAAVARRTQSYKEVNEKKTRKTKERPRPLKTSQSMNTLTEWVLHPAMARPKPCPEVLMNQTPHIRTHKLVINPCPLPPVFLLAVLYANPNSRDGCLSQTTTVTLCVYAFGVWNALWRPFAGLLQCQFQQWHFPHAGERHTGGHTQHQRSTAWQIEWQRGRQSRKEIPDWHWSQDWRSCSLLMSDFKENQCHKDMQ